VLFYTQKLDVHSAQERIANKERINMYPES